MTTKASRPRTPREMAASMIALATSVTVTPQEAQRIATALCCMAESLSAGRPGQSPARIALNKSVAADYFALATRFVPVSAADEAVSRVRATRFEGEAEVALAQ